MYLPVKKRLLVSILGNARSDGSRNIARVGKLMNKIAADDGQKFPRRYDDKAILSKEPKK